MEVRLIQNNTKKDAVDAFYIPSANPENWLRVLNKNAIAIENSTCYLVPTSISDITVAGLFVILETPVKQTDLLVQHPYFKETAHLFLPFGASLFPPLTSNELESIFKYDVQCFHPTIGLIGWEFKEAFNWKSIHFNLKKSQLKWSFATYKPFVLPKITSISFVAPENEETLINELENEVEKKDLKDIPLDKNEKTTLKDNIFSKIGKPLLKAGIAITGTIIGSVGILGGLLSFILSNSGGFSSSASSSSTSHSTSVSGSSGVGKSQLEKLHEWFRNNLEKLEKEQQKELNKLLKMFDDNLSEALKYAIPLGGDELGRGTNAPNFKLTQNSTSFNMNNMGTGISSFGWNTSNHYYELRQKYLKAAEKEIANKNYRKAAYIYGHLLKDYHSTANVLEKGGYYEEAAILYLEKLKNKSGAANCYERGMLYDKAIELHKDLENNEKIAELYAKTGNIELSEEYFKITSKNFENKRDYLNAARIEKEKLNDAETSKNLLLKGWKNATNSEVCLGKYFEEHFEEDPKNMSRVIQNVYTSHTNLSSESRFLNALTNTPLDKYNAKETSTNIAYKIVSNQITNGNNKDIHLLKNFVDDTILSSDINRFISKTPRKISTLKTEKIALDKTINWTEAIKHGHEILVAGHNNKRWFIARINTYQNIEYYTLKNKFHDYSRIRFFNNPYYTDTILISFTGQHSLVTEKLIMERSKYFDKKLTLACYHEFQENNAQYTLNFTHFFKLASDEKGVNIHKYNFNRTLEKTVYLANNDELGINEQSKIHFFNNYIFTFSNNFFYAFHENSGKIIELKLDTGIQDFQILDTENILIRTYSGNTIYQLKEDKFLCKVAFFSGDFFGKDSQFLGSTKVLLYSEKMIKFYSVNSVPEMIDNKSFNHIIKCLPIGRDKYAVLTTNEIEIHHLNLIF